MDILYANVTATMAATCHWGCDIENALLTLSLDSSYVSSDVKCGL